MTNPDIPLNLALVPQTYKAAPRKRKVMRSAIGNAADAIGPISRNCEIFCLTNGQFSVIDVLDYVLDTTGRASIDLATWTAADGDIRRAHAFLLSGRIERVRMIVDPSFRTRKPEFCKTLIELFGNNAIRTTPIHGKFAIIRNDQWNIAIRTSMNLNVNNRIETIEISDDAALSDVIQGFVDDAFSKSSVANFKSQSLSQNAKHDIKSQLLF